MGTRKPARHLPRTVLVLCLGFASLAIGGGPAARARDTGAATNSGAAWDTADIGVGRVEGAAALNVRRGPGAEHKSIGMLHRGDTVGIEAIVGKWALVHSPDLSGYVNRAFIEIADSSDQPLPTATAIPGNSGTTPPPISAAANSDPAVGPEARPPIARLVPEVREEVRRILALSEALHQDIEEMRRVPPQAARGETSIGVQVGVGLLGLGGVIGFFIGTILGRRQERGGRSRVRF